MIEEIARSGAECPSDEVLMKWKETSVIHHHLAILILNVCNRRDGESSLSIEQQELLTNHPQGPELVSRLVVKMLDEAS